MRKILCKNFGKTEKDSVIRTGIREEIVMIRERLKKEAIRFRLAEESELDIVFRIFQCASKHMEKLPE